MAVTPIIAGAAVKGPTAKIMGELGIEVSAGSVAQFYGGIIDGFVDDIRNEAYHSDDLRQVQLDTLMTDEQIKAALARDILAWIKRLGAMSLWAIIPVKPLENAKSRLGARFSARAAL